MVNISSSSDTIYSHPGVPLYDHLDRVAQNCIYLNSQHTIIPPIGINSEDIQTLITLTGVCHDLGKATHYFQEYLFAEENRKAELKGSGLSNHATLSSLIAYVVAQKLFVRSSSASDEWKSTLAYLTIMIVKKHHGKLDDLQEDLIATFKQDSIIEILQRQIVSIQNQQFKRLFDTILESYFGGILKWDEVTEKLSEVLKSGFGRIQFLYLAKNTSTFPYFLCLYGFSILLQADKSDAIFSSKHTVTLPDIPSEIVDAYRINKGFDKSTGDLNEMRNDIYNNVNEQIQSFDLESNRILSITVPTGTGKTLAGLNAGLKLKNRVQAKYSNTQWTVIYGLPYTSIIDQNYQVFEEVLTTEIPELNSQYLLKHHYLSDLVYTTGQGEYQTNESQFFIEGWDTSVVVTTFIQILHAFFSPNNRSSRKFHKLVNSIVILDEVQTVPYKYWKVLNRVLRDFANFFNTYFILMTATQPYIFKPDSDSVLELTKNNTQYYQKLSRIILHPILTERTIDDFLDWCSHLLKENTEKQILIVLNTIQSSKSVYGSLKELFDKDFQFFYLSTNLIPLQRLQRIYEIKQTKKPTIIVSTQLVEAGVDIDVDIVIRDLGPLDAISQVSGRCNRNNEGKGDVYLIHLINDRQQWNRAFCQYIYEPFLLENTRRLFRNQDIIEEKEYLDFINNYFRYIDEVGDPSISNGLIKNILQLQFTEVRKKFVLINRSYATEDIFIEYDNDAIVLWRQFEKLLKSPVDDIWQKKADVQAIRRKMNNYIISIAATKPIGKTPESNYPIIYFSKEELNSTYDSNTGFYTTDEHSTLLF